MMPSASATVGPAGIDPGINISVFHNIDMVGTFGWPVDATVRVDVLRNDVLIGTSTGQTFDAAPDGGALEVNHGPLGAPLPGDCWVGHTPDIRPGDLVRVTSGTSVNEVIVDNIDLIGPATLNAPVGGVEMVEVKGVALTAAGDEIPLADINSGEFRTVLPGGQFRANPDAIVDDPTVPGGFIMQYRSPYDGFRRPADSTIEQRRNALLNEDGHMTGFGHAAPLPDEAMLVEGFEDATTPAPGCEGSPMARDAVTSINPGKLNVATMAAGGNLQIGGVSFDATDVSVTVGALPAINVTPTGAAGGPQTWTASVPLAEVATLPDGDVTISMSSTRGGTALPGASMSLAKDVVAPGAPAISPNGGAIAGVTPVSLSGDDELRYTVGNGSQAAPTASSGLVFNAQFNVVPGQTVKAIAVDAAGNASGVTTASFTQAATPPVVTPPVVRPPVVTPPGGGSAAIVALAPGLRQAKSGKPGGNDTATARWRAPVANGAVLNGYEVRALKMRPGRSAKIQPAVVVEDRNAQSLKMSLPAGRYKFQVRAVSAAGKSPWSERSNQVRSR
jgi:hypothetical protein